MGTIAVSLGVTAIAENQLDLEAIFFAARQKPAQERAAYLDQVCGDDLVLRQRVEQFLSAQAEMGSFLVSGALPLVATVDEQPLSEAPGTVIGPYKLLEQIGEGGFGVVFMAEQSQPVRRKVALKVLKPGMDTKQVIARFEAERQALAIMDHPNIAKVHDGGATPSGRPYFVMELVKGVPITEFCDQNHLTPRQRLVLLIPVCQAVQHAHHKRIIHRDLKPSNVLVTMYDVTPVVKVIDFGVAKALGEELTDRTLFTGFAQMIGTPLYMSPEQAGQSGLDIDTRSDIYSLGVLLYELLTGTTPFDKERLKTAGYDEMRRIIREEEPPKPSTRMSTLGQAATTISTERKSDPKRLSQLFRGELDWIVMKCLEKDRNRRYETANGLATDLQRYLLDEPVQACPPSAWYRFRKFARRHKAALGGGGLVAAALIAGTVVSCYFAVQASKRASEAETARNLATTGEKQAREDEGRALEAERTARLREAEALVGRAHGIRLSRRPGQRFAALDALGKAAAIGRELGHTSEWFDRLRNEAIAALALPDIHITKVFGSFPAGSPRVELSDDFEYYACTTDKGSCVIRRVADDAEVARLPELGEPAEAWFGVGRTLGVYGTSTNRFRLWDLSGAEPVVRFEERDTTLVSFRHDGRLLAVQHVDGSISVYETASGKRLYRLTPGSLTPSRSGEERGRGRGT